MAAQAATWPLRADTARRGSVRVWQRNIHSVAGFGMQCTVVVFSFAAKIKLTTQSAAIPAAASDTKQSVTPVTCCSSASASAVPKATSGTCTIVVFAFTLEDESAVALGSESEFESDSCNQTKYSFESTNVASSSRPIRATRRFASFLDRMRSINS